MWHGGICGKVVDSTDMDMLVDFFNIQVAGSVDNHVNFNPFIVWHGGVSCKVMDSTNVDLLVDVFNHAG